MVVRIVGATEWTSLEIAKLVVGALTPLLLFVLGLSVSRAARKVEETQWASRTIVQRRLEIHRELAPMLNDIYCFFTGVGHYRDISPPRVIAVKRSADKLFFVNAELFSPSFRIHYDAFIDICFRHYAGAPGEPAKLRSDEEFQRELRGTDWEEAWSALFDEADVPGTDLVRKHYRNLMESFGGEVGARA